jgi:hypothetical protein
MNEGMANSMVAIKVMENDDWFETQQSKLVALPNINAP